MKTLTKAQIDELFQFTKTHRIRYYDLQTEVVDHLASAIEAKWEENPNLSFKKALNEVYAGFGIFGFGKLEQEKRETIHTKIKRNVWKYVQSFLTPPKVLLTLTLIFLWYQCLVQIGSAVVIVNLIGFVFGILFAGLLYLKHREEKVLFDAFLEIHTFYSWSGFVIYMYYIPPFIHIDFTISNPMVLGIIASIHVLMLLTFMGIYQYLVEMIEEVKKRHPQYDFSRG
ncbi:MAG: hypothetical protein AB8G86_21785 [Saprospiraceae bacterium]